MYYDFSEQNISEEDPDYESVDNVKPIIKIEERIGFIGSGTMAFVIGSGLINKGVVEAKKILASGMKLSSMTHWKEIGAKVTTNNEDVLIKSDIIFICLKPDAVEPMSMEIQKQHIRSVRDRDKLFVSVVAGMTINTIEKFFYFIPEIKVIRTMPNTAMQVAEGCTVFTPGRYVTQPDVEKIFMILNSLGMAHEVPEKMINAFSAITGCGPAYVYMIIEALADGGVKQGIPKSTAIQFAAQTLYGSAKTLLETGKHPAALKDEICASMVITQDINNCEIRHLFMNAVEKATEKAAKLGHTEMD